MRTLIAITSVLLSACGGAETPAPASTSGSGPRAEADGHAVVIHRDHRAGESFEGTYHGTSEMEQVLTVEGQPAGGEAVRSEIFLKANVVVSEVSANGKATLSEYTVIECNTGGDSPVEILPAGAVIIVRASEDVDGGSITLRGGELTEDQVELIDLVVDTHISQRDDDQIFGSSTPRAVGESWPINGEMAAQDLSRIPKMQFASESVSGTTTLSSLEDVDGMPCMLLNAAMAAEGFEMTGFPPGARVTSTSLEMTMGGALPIDTAQPRLRSEMSMTMRVVVELPTDDGRTAVMAVDNRQTSTTEIRARAGG